MQRPFVVLCLGMALTLAGFGCGTTNDTRVEMTSDFTPPTGEASNPPPASAGERRLLMATSTDGITFTPTGETFTDQANVSDMIVTEDGTIYEYYIGQGIGIEPEWTVVAISSDNGETWVYKYLVLEDWPSNRAPSDPDVVLLEDGTFRMYFVGEVNPRPDNQLGINYGTSTDGIHFTFGGTALKMSQTAVDSTTFYFKGKWHMYVFDDKNPWQFYATSTDGITFTSDEQPYQFMAGKESYFGSNPIVEEDQVRMFGFGKPGTDIKSFVSTDGKNWTVESGSRLVADDAALQGARYLQDLSVGKLLDGTYLMLYVTDYPNN
jgi:hypothetical protein